jgi:hypothetical protein
MAGRNCYNCVYSCHDPELWLRLLGLGEPLLPRCANHPCWPGRLHDVPGVPCRNYRPRPTTPTGDVRMIPLGDGCYAYVDAADYDWLNGYYWHLHNGYAARKEKGKIILMHTQIMQPPKGMVVDHIQGNRLNNCRCNLRVCTRAENLRNQSRQGDSSSPYKGVIHDKGTVRWRAQLCFQGQRIPLGRFATAIEAARAYDRGAVQWFREYARLNFPAEWPPERRAQLYAETQAEYDALIAQLAAAKKRKAGKPKPKNRKAVEKRPKGNKKQSRTSS